MKTHCDRDRAPERRLPRASWRRSESGFSLVEGLIAAALLLVIAAGILPLYTRAVSSNIAGGRSSQLSAFASADIEEDNQTSVDRADWSLGLSGGVLDLGTLFWVGGQVYASEAVPYTIGNQHQKWLASPADSDGLVFWSRNVTIRKYSLSDLQILAGTDVSDDEITAVGHPMLLDTPLTDDANGHLTEFRVSIKERRGTLPAATGQRTTVSHFRTL